MKKSILAMILSATILFTLLCSCAEHNKTGGNEGNAENNPKELNWYGWYDEQGYMPTILKAFEEKSGIKVKPTYIDNDGYSDKLVVMLTGDADLDVFDTSTVKEYVKYRDAGNLVDLTPYMEKSQIDPAVYGSSFLSTEKDGKYYALPYRNMCFSLYYNKVIFDQEGIEYPQQLTWEEYAELAKKLTKTREDGSKQWGGFLIDWIGEPIMTVQKGSNILDSDTSALREWMEFMNRLYNVDQSHMSFEEMKSTSVDGLKIFWAGDVAMLINGEWTIGNTKQELESNPGISEKFDLGVTYMPLPDGMDTPVTVGGASCFSMINHKSEKIDEAFAFIEYLTGEQGAEHIVGANMMPAYINDEIIDLYQDAVAVPGVETQLLTDTLYECAPVTEFAEVDTIWREQKELYLIGDESLDDAIADFETRRADVLGS